MYQSEISQSQIMYHFIAELYRHIYLCYKIVHSGIFVWCILWLWDETNVNVILNLRVRIMAKSLTYFHRIYILSIYDQWYTIRRSHGYVIFVALLADAKEFRFIVLRLTIGGRVLINECYFLIISRHSVGTTKIFSSIFYAMHNKIFGVKRDCVNWWISELDSTSHQNEHGYFKLIWFSSLYILKFF